MPDYKALAERLVKNAIDNKLGGLQETLVYRCFNSDGEYDPETGTAAPDFTDKTIKLVVTRPSFDEVDKLGVLASDAKLVIPGLSLGREPTDDDTVTRRGAVWQVKKWKGVPGDSVYLVFIRKT